MFIKTGGSTVALQILTFLREKFEYQYPEISLSYNIPIELILMLFHYFENFIIDSNQLLTIPIQLLLLYLFGSIFFFFLLFFVKAKDGKP